MNGRAFQVREGTNNGGMSKIREGEKDVGQRQEN